MKLGKGVNELIVTKEMSNESTALKAELLGTKNVMGKGDNL